MRVYQLQGLEIFFWVSLENLQSQWSGAYVNTSSREAAKDKNNWKTERQKALRSLDLGIKNIAFLYGKSRGVNLLEFIIHNFIILLGLLIVAFLICPIKNVIGLNCILSLLHIYIWNRLKGLC